NELFAARAPLLRATMLIAAGQPALAVLATVDPLGLEQLRPALDWILLRGRLPGDEVAQRQNDALLARCTHLELLGYRAPLLALEAKLSAELAKPTQARGSAEAALDAVEHCIPNLLPLICTWLATAFKSAGSEADARRCIRRGCEWIERTARDSVPA